jgi:hypothetical protein
VQVRDVRAEEDCLGAAGVEVVKPVERMPWGLVEAGFTTLKVTSCTWSKYRMTIPSGAPTDRLPGVRWQGCGPRAPAICADGPQPYLDLDPPHSRHLRALIRGGPGAAVRFAISSDPRIGGRAVVRCGDSVAGKRPCAAPP